MDIVLFDIACFGIGLLVGLFVDAIVRVIKGDI